MSFTVEFELTEADIVRFRQWSWQHADKQAGYRRFWWLAAAVALLGAGLLTAIGLPVRRFGGVVCVALFAAYLLGVLDVHLASRDTRQRLTKTMRPRWPTRIEIGEAGIEAGSPAGRFLYYWPTITHVDHWDGVLLISAGPSLGFPVNVRDVWPDQLAAMVAYCREKMRPTAS